MSNQKEGKKNQELAGRKADPKDLFMGRDGPFGKKVPRIEQSNNQKSPSSLPDSIKGTMKSSAKSLLTSRKSKIQPDVIHSNISSGIFNKGELPKSLSFLSSFTPSKEDIERWLHKDLQMNGFNAPISPVSFTRTKRSLGQENDLEDTQCDTVVSDSEYLRVIQHHKLAINTLMLSLQSKQRVLNLRNQLAQKPIKEEDRPTSVYYALNQRLAQRQVQVNIENSKNATLQQDLLDASKRLQESIAKRDKLLRELEDSKRKASIKKIFIDKARKDLIQGLSSKFRQLLNRRNLIDCVNSDACDQKFMSLNDSEASIAAAFQEILDEIEPVLKLKLTSPSFQGNLDISQLINDISCRHSIQHIVQAASPSKIMFELKLRAAELAEGSRRELERRSVHSLLEERVKSTYRRLISETFKNLPTIDYSSGDFLEDVKRNLLYRQLELLQRMKLRNNPDKNLVDLEKQSTIIANELPPLPSLICPDLSPALALNNFAAKLIKAQSRQIDVASSLKAISDLTFELRERIGQSPEVKIRPGLPADLARCSTESQSWLMPEIRAFDRLDLRCLMNISYSPPQPPNHIADQFPFDLSGIDGGILMPIAHLSINNPSYQTSLDCQGKSVSKWFLAPDWNLMSLIHVKYKIETHSQLIKLAKQLHLQEEEETQDLISQWQQNPPTASLTNNSDLSVILRLDLEVSYRRFMDSIRRFWETHYTADTETKVLSEIDQITHGQVVQTENNIRAIPYLINEGKELDTIFR